MSNVRLHNIPLPMLSDIYNFRQLSPHLAASGQPDEQELAAIAKAGFAVILNIALHDDPRYSLPDERRTVESLGMKYVHIPVQFSAPTDEDFDRFVSAMEEGKDQVMLVHCAANKRVSAFLGLYWHLLLGIPLEEAFALQRDIWEPDPVWLTFITRKLAAREA
jgi:uncharacterized protein (TIGR01244 family)